MKRKVKIIIVIFSVIIVIFTFILFLLGYNPVYNPLVVPIDDGFKMETKDTKWLIEALKLGIVKNIIIFNRATYVRLKHDSVIFNVLDPPNNIKYEIEQCGDVCKKDVFIEEEWK